MSTQQQKYSIGNQKQCLARYAAKHDMEIVETYQDTGKSGLTLAGRPALQQLIRDVLSTDRAFVAVLVYDVSRWGRFQDTDESAHYDYICKQAGCPIIYCAELFGTAKGPLVSLLKSMKRTMAAEYSRELGNKVLAGKKTSASNGFWCGGMANLGMKRVLVQPTSSTNIDMPRGARKSFQADWVVLAPGDSAEIKAVRRVFHLFVNERKSVAETTRIMQLERHKSFHGLEWNRSAVRRTLNAFCYSGDYVYNRTSRRLQARQTDKPKSQWIKHRKAWKPILPDGMFDAAQKILASTTSQFADEHKHRYSTDYLLNCLRALHALEGKITCDLLDESGITPISRTYRDHFGDLPTAYRLAGFEFGFRKDKSDVAKRKVKWLQEHLIERVLDEFAAIRTLATRTRKTRQLTIGGSTTLSVQVIVPWLIHKKKPRYKPKPDCAMNSSWTLLGRVTIDRLGLAGYLLLPQHGGGLMGFGTLGEAIGFLATHGPDSMPDCGQG